MWSDDPPEDYFLHVLQTVFATAEAHVVPFANPVLDCESASTVYVRVCKRLPLRARLVVAVLAMLRAC